MLAGAAILLEAAFSWHSQDFTGAIHPAIKSDPTVEESRAVVSTCEQGRLDFRGVTLLTQTEWGPFTIVEDKSSRVGMSKSTWPWR
jgi:hypothetical protein